MIRSHFGLTRNQFDTETVTLLAHRRTSPLNGLKFPAVPLLAPSSVVTGHAAQPPGMSPVCAVNDTGLPPVVNGLNPVTSSGAMFVTVNVAPPLFVTGNQPKHRHTRKTRKNQKLLGRSRFIAVNTPNRPLSIRPRCQPFA
jgi:hypothetical protein